MAEVIGLAAGISGLIGSIFQLTRLSYEYISAVNGARNSTSKYLQEVLALCTVLLMLEEALKTPAMRANLSADYVSALSEAIEGCQNDLGLLKEKLEKGKHSSLRAFVWPFQERETKKLIEMFHRWRGTFHALVSASTFDVSRETLIEVRGARSEMKRSEILSWVLQSPSTAANDEIFLDCCPGTCSWMLQQDMFTAWLGEHGGVLACYGGPGVGKTVLSSFIVNHLREARDHVVLYHYFDCRSEDNQEHATHKVVRSLLRQLLQAQRELPDDIVQLYESWTTNGVAPDDWVEVFLKSLDRATGTYIVLDALDECPDRRKMLKLLRRLASSRAKVFITSRPAADLPIEVTNGQSMNFSAATMDLKIFLQTRISENEDLEALLSDSLRAEVVSKIVEYADGVFLFSRMAMDLLALAPTVRQIRQALLHLPKDLTSAYESTFRRILSLPSASKELALKALSWVHLAKRPLRVEELLHALALEPGDDHVDVENVTTPRVLMAACQGLIYIREHDGTVRLAHATVQDFLESHRTKYFDHAELSIARTCIVYLAQADFHETSCTSAQDLEKRLNNYSLLEYAASQWGSHVKSCEGSLLADIDKLFGEPNAILNATQVLHYCRRRAYSTPDAAFRAIPTGFSKLHVVSFWNLIATAAHQTSPREAIDARDSLGWTPLHWAAARGHVDILNYLLDHGADIEAQDPQRWTPIFWSAFWGRPEAALLLIEKGADFEIRDIQGRTPLHIAVSRANPSICEQLLKFGANAYARAKNGSTPMDDALTSHEPDVTTLFESFSRRPTVAKPGSWKAPLELAADDNDESLFAKTLGEENALSKTPGWKHPFDVSLENMHEHINALNPNCLWKLTSELLQLEAGWLNELEYTTFVLIYAILTKRRDMVQYLIRYGVNVQQTVTFGTLNESYYTSLHLAAFTGHLPLVLLLLSHGVDPIVADCHGKTPLHYSAQLGHWEVMKALAKEVRLLDIADGNGETALLLVAAREPNAYSDTVETDCVAAVDILISFGANPNIADIRGRTPLHAAVETERRRVVQLLLQSGAEPNALEYTTGRYGGEMRHTPFTLACSEYDFGMACTIMNLSTVSLPEDIDLSRALVIAVQDGNADMVKRFLDLGVRPSDRPIIITTLHCFQQAMDSPDNGDALLDWETEQPVDKLLVPDRYLDVLQVLVNAGEDTNAKDDETGDTALLIALRISSSTKIVKFLLSKGAELTSKNKAGSGALHCAALSGNLELVKLVTSLEADLGEISSNDPTTLSEAALGGHVEVVAHLMAQSNQHIRGDSSVGWLFIAHLRRDMNSPTFSEFQQLISQNKDTTMLNSQCRKGRTLMHTACLAGSDSVIEQLLRLDADPNIRDNRGNTALHVAARSGRSEAIISLLVQHGADVRTRNGEGRFSCNFLDSATALHMAVLSGSPITTRAVLFAACGDDTQENIIKDTPLGADTSMNSPSTERSTTTFINLGVSYGSALSSLTAEGTTALMMAARQGSLEIVKFLIDHGANVNIMGGGGSGGTSALDRARQSGNKEIVELITKRGGRSFDSYYY